MNAEAQVIYLGRPYPHAKLIVGGERAFLGSQNISVSSLDRNREVGILVEGGVVGKALHWFERDSDVGKKK